MEVDIRYFILDLPINKLGEFDKDFDFYDFFSDSRVLRTRALIKKYNV